MAEIRISGPQRAEIQEERLAARRDTPRQRVQATRVIRKEEERAWTESSAKPKLTAAISNALQRKSACPGLQHSPRLPVATRT